MSRRFDRSRYRQRSQVETVMSMLKRNLDPALGARTDRSRNREMLLKALTHISPSSDDNPELFYRAQ